MEKTISNEVKEIDQLTKHIQLIHSKSGHYKTVLYSVNPLYYNVVTRVNYITNLLWIDHINKIIALKPELNIDKISKVNWLTMIKSYRRDLELRLQTN